MLTEAKFLLFLYFLLYARISHGHSELLVIGLRGQVDDASYRCRRSAEVFGYHYQELDFSALGRTFDDVPEDAAINEIRHSVDQADIQGIQNVLIVDSHSSILLARPENLLDTAKALKTDFLFLSKKNDEESSIFKGILAKTTALKMILTGAFTMKEIKENLRKIGAIEDLDCHLFQLITKISDDVRIRYDGDHGYLQNVQKDTIPIVAFSAADADSKMKFNSLTNYLARAWSPETGCQQCDEDLIDLSSRKKLEYPIIMLSLFVSRPTPFMEKFFRRIANLTYPKNRIHLTVHNPFEEQEKYHTAFLDQFGSQYRSVRTIDPIQHPRTRSAFNVAAASCLEITECEFLFYVDATAHFTESETLEALVSANRSIIAPVMSRRSGFWSTFWGAMTTTGGYQRSDDYFDIVERRKVGVWHVPLVGSTFLMSRWAISEITGDLQEDEFYNSITKASLTKNVFEYATNRIIFGYLINPGSANLSHLHDDLWQLFDNPMDWEEEYIHPEYYKWANESIKLEDFEQPCNDVFWIPLMTERFCKQLIEELENFGEWSDGSNNDPRLEGGYENVPTRDIHMRQIDWEEHWLHVLKSYVYPIQLKLFEMYFDKPTARMNFVVRYRPDEQPSLRYHHDASTYTLDMALNRAHIDYQGGGVRFSRQNCTLVDTRVGWPLIFPGRLTHLHEGLETTAGTRYIFVTFINP